MTPASGDQTDLWPSSGYRYLQIGESRQLQATDEFLRFILQRPELALVAESCAAERALHEALLAQPRRAVSAADIAALGDPDARDNYRVVVAFRDLLLDYPSLESAYLAVCSGQVKALVAPVLVDLLVHAIGRHLVDDCDDVYQWRAAELLFRRQKVSVEQGILLADEALLAQRQPRAMTVLQSLIQQALIEPEGGTGAAAPRQILDVLNQHTQDRYWQHSEAFDMVMSLNLDEPGVHALCRVLERWLWHFRAVDAHIQPLASIQDEHWRWHLGLDAESSRILNTLYQGQALSAAEQRQLLVLLRLDFIDQQPVQPPVRGHPVYMAIAMDKDNCLRLKPQNLLFNLPLVTL